MCFFYDSLFYLLLIVSLERCIPRWLISKTVVWSLSTFRLPTADGRWIQGKSSVVPFYTSSFCLWEVSIAVIHGGIRSSSIECFIKYPAFASVKTVTQPPKSFVHSKLLLLVLKKFVVGTINVEHTASQHPLRTLMQISYTYAHAWYESNPTSIVPS